MKLAALIHRRSFSNPAASGPVAEAPQPMGQARETFDFSAPADPEALEERACIIAEGCGMEYAQALQEARWQAERAASWAAFRRNAERILSAPQGQQWALIQRYEAEAAARYGASMA